MFARVSFWKVSTYTSTWSTSCHVRICPFLHSSRCVSCPLCASFSTRRVVKDKGCIMQLTKRSHIQPLLQIWPPQHACLYTNIQAHPPHIVHAHARITTTTYITCARIHIQTKEHIGTKACTHTCTHANTDTHTHAPAAAGPLAAAAVSACSQQTA
jgi:hypothetical protein